MDPITQLIIQEHELKLIDKSLDTILEGYDLKCQQCGRVITIVKDGQGPLACCNRRMFVMGSNPEDMHGQGEVEVGQEGAIKNALKGEVVDPDFQVKLKNVNFSPYNQSETQKKVKDDREKVKNAKELRSMATKDPDEVNVVPRDRKEVHHSELLQKYGGEKKVSEAVVSADPTEKERDDIQQSLMKSLGSSFSSSKSVEFTPDNQADVQKAREGKRVNEAGFETKPKGWTDKSVKKYGQSLVKGGGRKKGFFDKCVKKMKDKMENPEGFCASLKDEAWDSTYWRGKDKSDYETQKKVKKHKNV